MRLLLALPLVIAVAGCGSSGLAGSATPGPTSPSSGGVDVCSLITSTYLTCTPGAGGAPAHLDPKVGTSAGMLAAGNDARLRSIDPNKGAVLGIFTPTPESTAERTLANAGGVLLGHGGGIVYYAPAGQIGVAAADSVCRAITDFPGHTKAVPTAHACSAQELRDGVRAAAGALPVGATGRVFDAAIFDGYPTGGDPSINSFKATCGDGTYDSSDLYEATTWEVVSSDPKGTGATGLALKMTVQPAPSCGNFYPIACCE